MLQLAHRTSAPKATRVSIRTAVCTVMCKDPAILAPASGLDSPYCVRMAISPGISYSARLISLRPKSARVKSATRKSIGGSLGEASHIQGIADALSGWARSQDPTPHLRDLGACVFQA